MVLGVGWYYTDTVLFWCRNCEDEELGVLHRLVQRSFS